MTKFKKGDKVKLTIIQEIGVSAPHLKVGDVGIVTGYFNYPDLVVVQFENIAPGLRDSYAFDDFELDLV